MRKAQSGRWTNEDCGGKGLGNPRRRHQVGEQNRKTQRSAQHGRGKLNTHCRVVGRKQQRNTIQQVSSQRNKWHRWHNAGTVPQVLPLAKPFRQIQRLRDCIHKVASSVPSCRGGVLELSCIQEHQSHVDAIDLAQENNSMCTHPAVFTISAMYVCMYVCMYVM